MKYLQIRIKRGDSNKGENQMVYPAIYDANEVEGVMIGSILYTGEIGKGADEEDCMLCVGDDFIADDYIAAGGGDIVEVTEAEVDTFMVTRWEGRNDAEEQVIDINKILSVMMKKTLNISRTTEDLDAINPDKRTPGINRINKNHNRFFHKYVADNV